MAKLAGVSRATASRAINGSGLVSAEARDAVEQAVERLSYAPNRAARSLVTRRTDTIAVVVSEPESRVFSDRSSARWCTASSPRSPRPSSSSALLRRHPDIDGGFAANDLMALGALQALEAAGRLVPADVAVVGFDDMAEARSAEPPLTTMRQPLAAMTRAMTGLLLRCIEGTASADEHLVFPTRLIARASA